MSLARVSVLRGDGEDEGLPFIDDYIHTSEKVVDYLTEYSGINGMCHYCALGAEADSKDRCRWRLGSDGFTTYFGAVEDCIQKAEITCVVEFRTTFSQTDCNPTHSRRPWLCIHWTWPAQRLPYNQYVQRYRRVAPRLICVLPDIFVPPEQVVDTVVLYYEPARHRKLSLRFLAWFLLKQDIQLAEHDSIEDARSALLLYKKYLDFIEEGRFKDVMEDIFESGKRLVSRAQPRARALLIECQLQGFKPPPVPGAPAGVTHSPLPSAPSTPDIAEGRLVGNSLYPTNPAFSPGITGNSGTPNHPGGSTHRHGRVPSGWNSNNMRHAVGNRRPGPGAQNGGLPMGVPGQPLAPGMRRWR